MIEFERVVKRYPGQEPALHALDLKIEEGEFFVLIGPSGCGKTTTLKLINRLIPRTEGELRIAGRSVDEYDVYELRWNIGYVLQQIALFPHLTIGENIAIVPELKGWDKRRIRARVDELLAMVGLEPSDYRTRRPAELSGGQQQRVGVARALAADPQILLMDEPFSALDPLSREKLQNDLVDLQRTIRKTIVFVTHDMQEALKLGDRICLMNEGRVVQVDTPAGFRTRPANAFAERFVGAGPGAVAGSLSIGEVLRRLPAAGDAMSGGEAPAATGQVSDGRGTARSVRVVSAELPLRDALELLAEEEELAVHEDDRCLGTISRRELLRFLADRLREEESR
ncbi:glycine/betaine ABC transporter ATP-binding protein [Paenibacillus sp. J31TS4]|uniref:ABC transporter ATP-binding protein n=1 Tax=Paenibacillus sp. J31TS4 TaxID=2807195 RepID=UPI001B2ABA69|nr:ABC transporter ATP-binding protein [Paenibacillus sp. J31TS4]GIP39828.1 glycine/betaine ABC transporter ATP-binding protein [Paenibacillus sp. J31TS4]